MDDGPTHADMRDLIDVLVGIKLAIENLTHEIERDTTDLLNAIEGNTSTAD